jgi:K+/H+ antiporter YhaU regulatory subunit KhtT
MKDKTQKAPLARFEMIAIDIAYNIVNGEWAEGDTIMGRSTLSGKYSVSPETIRKAVKLLEESGVVKVLDKKGIRVISVESASKYVRDHKAKDKILTMREEIRGLVEEKERINNLIFQKVDSVIEQAMLLRNIGVISPLETKVLPHSHVIGKTIGQVRFWEHTGSTIIGINRMGHLYLSPGPKLVFFEGDILLYVGNAHDNSEQVHRFVNHTRVDF